MAYTRETEAGQVARDLASQIKGKTVLITGASPGSLGAMFAQTIAEHSPRIMILASRGAEKLQETAESITGTKDMIVKVLEIKLDSFESIHEAAERVIAWEDVPHIDVVVNSAEIMAVPFELTEDGFERHFANNFLGPFLFTNLIMDKVLQSMSPRVVNVSSSGHRLSPVRYDYNFQDGKVYDMWRAYGQSKTGNNLFSVALAEKLSKRGLVAASLHPGVINAGGLDGLSDWWAGEYGAALRQVDVEMGNRWSIVGRANFDFKTPEQAVATHVYTSFSPDVAKNNGAYFADCQACDPLGTEVFPWAMAKAESERVWKLAERLVGQEFEY